MSNNTSTDHPEDVTFDNPANNNTIPTFPLRPSFRDFQNQLRRESQVVVFDGCPNDPYHPSSMPIYQTSTFVQPSAVKFGSYDYTRSGNPTRTALEKHVALLENAHAAFAFTSGMAALNTLTNTFLVSGDHFLIGSDIYGGMHRLATKITSKMGVTVGFVDTTDLDAVRRAIQPNTRLLHIESPSNPLMRITDLRALSKIMKKNNILFSIDSTMTSPILMKPLTLGVDIVVHSATKFFGGHADAMGGFIAVNTSELANRVAFVQNAEGTAMAPFDCWLFLRGIKTMAIRIERAQENAMAIAQFLQEHKMVSHVNYAGLSNTPEQKASRDLHFSQARGAGCVLSFTMGGNTRLSERFCDACRIFKLTVSFGSCNSLVELPCLMSHASIDPDKRTLPPDLVRVSVGIEHIDDLLEDVKQALELAASNIPDIPAFMKRTGQPIDSPAVQPQPTPEVGVFDSKFEDLPLVPAADPPVSKL